MKILLAMDTSPASYAALEETVARPWPADSSFEVLSVVEPSHLWTTSEVAQECALRAGQVVDQAAELLRGKGWQAASTTLQGDPKAVIVDRVRKFGADFLIVGSHGVTAISKFLLGDVAAAVLRYAPCSVEIVRAAAKTDCRGGIKILLATDGFEYSEQAARSIAERPWLAGTEVRVLSAVELVLPTTRVHFEIPFIDSAFMAAARGEAMKRSRDAIARAVEILSSSSALVVSESISVLWEHPKRIILDEATGWGANLIVLGSHGRHGIDRFLVGSVSEAVAMHAACSVEVIRKIR
jgi:nucleotide-binding universal stress UspA family protein